MKKVNEFVCAPGTKSTGKATRVSVGVVSAIALGSLAMGCGPDLADDAEAPVVAEATSPIVGGNPVSASSWGYVSFNSTIGFCSGTLMSNSWVLTARHCVGAPDIASPNFRVGMDAQSSSVAEVIPYPDDDVALLRLATPLSMNGSTSGYELRLYPFRNGTLTPNTNIPCFGFGVFVNNGTPGTFRYAWLPVRSWRLSGHLEVDQSNSGQFLAPGDSGGSCLTRLSSGEFVLAGVTSQLVNGGAYNILVDPDFFRTWYANVRATHAIVSAGSGKCLDSGAEQQWACQDIPAMAWRLTPSGGGWYEIRTSTTGHCLGSSGGPLSTQDCDSSNRTHWNLVNASGDFYTIRNGATGQCLDVPGSATGDGVPLQTYACNGGTNQLFRFDTRFDSMYQSLTPSVANGISCLDVQGGGTNAGALLQLYGCNGGDNQQWSLQRASGGMHTAHPRQAAAMCANVPSASTAELVQLQQYPCSNAPNERLVAHWRGGSYNFAVANSGLCLSAWAQSATSNGAPVEQIACGRAGYSQLWNLY